MMRFAHLPCHSLAAAGLLIAVGGSLAAQAPNPAPASDDPAALVSQGQKLSAEGNQTAALALYKRALQQNPRLDNAHVAEGVALDLDGQYPAARAHLEQAIAMAPNDSAKARALRTMAVSYAFTRNADEAAKYERQVIDAANARQDWLGAADVDNELARIYLESGDIDNAYKTYQSGHETALKKTGLTSAERDLWDFRWDQPGPGEVLPVPNGIRGALPGRLQDRPFRAPEGRSARSLHLVLDGTGIRENGRQDPRDRLLPTGTHDQHPQPAKRVRSTTRENEDCGLILSLCIARSVSSLSRRHRRGCRSLNREPGPRPPAA
jgi:hypothetical protein